MSQLDINKRLEDATGRGDYEYWLSEEDISDIARIKYRYGTKARPDIVFRVISQNYRKSLEGDINEFIKNNEGKGLKQSLTTIINVNSNHWVTLVISFQNHTFSGYFADSLGKKLSDYPIIKEIMENYSDTVPTADLSDGIHQQQNDNYNCGLWALENAADINQMLQRGGNTEEKIDNLKNKILKRPKDAQYFRNIREDLSKKLKADPDRQNRDESFMKDTNRPENNSTGPFFSASESQAVAADSKTKDLVLLYDLLKRIDSFVKEDTRQQEDIVNLLRYISTTFSALYRNNADEECIRNIYGKRNYSKGGKENKKHIDFEQLSFFTNYPDDRVATAISDEILYDYVKFSAEFEKLKNNTGVILKKESAKLQSFALNDEYWADISKMLPTDFENLGSLLTVISKYYDQRFIDEMRSERHTNHLKSIDKENEPKRWRYTLARILTIFGEISKNLSQDFKKSHPHLPWNEFSKIRDQLAHVHHKYISECDPDIQNLYDEIAQDGLVALKLQLDSLKATAIQGAAGKNKTQSSVDLSGNIFTKLFRAFSSTKSKKPKEDNKPDDTSNKPRRILENLIKEIEILESFVKSSSTDTGKRDYAYEYCLGVIGQLFRDIKECKNEDIDTITRENLTVQHDIKSTITARNKKIMHDPLNDNTFHLLDLMDKQTLRMLEDIKAIARVVDNRITEQKLDNYEKINKLTDVYRNLGWSFYRLNMTQATEYFKKALESTYPEFYAECIGLSPPFEILEIVTDEGQEKNRLEERIQHNAETQTRFFVQQVNKKLMLNRVVLKFEITACLMREKKLQEAHRQCSEALDIINKYDLSEIIDYSYHILILKFKIITASPDDKGVAYNTHKNEIEMKDYKCFAEIAQDYACTLLRQRKYQEALEIINGVDLKGLGDDCLILKIAVYATKGAIYLESSDAPELCKSIEYLEKAASVLEEAYQHLENNLGELKSQQGDFLRIWHEHVSGRLALTLGNLAAKRHEIARSSPASTSASASCSISIDSEHYLLQPINRAIELQERLKIDASASYLTRAAIYETLYSKESNRSHLQKAVQDYMKVTDHENLKHRALAVTGLSSCFYGQFEYKDSISYSLEAMLYFSELTESDKNNEDRKDETDMDAFLKRPCTEMTENLKFVLEDSYEIGNKHQNKNELEKASFYYKKSLIAYNYVTSNRQSDSSSQMKAKIKNALRCLLDNSTKSYADKFFTDFFNLKFFIDNILQLFDSVKSGDSNKVDAMIKDGISVNARDENMFTALFWAIYATKNNLEIVRILIQNRANLNVVDEDGWSPLHYASQSGHLDICKELIENKCDINLKNKENKTPLNCAVEKQQWNVVIFLVAKGAEVDSVKLLCTFD